MTIHNENQDVNQVTEPKCAIAVSVQWLSIVLQLPSVYQNASPSETERAPSVLKIESLSKDGSVPACMHAILRACCSSMSMSASMSTFMSNGPKIVSSPAPPSPQCLAFHSPHAMQIASPRFASFRFPIQPAP